MTEFPVSLTSRRLAISQSRLVWCRVLFHYRVKGEGACGYTRYSVKSVVKVRFRFKRMILHSRNTTFPQNPATEYISMCFMFCCYIMLDFTGEQMRMLTMGTDDQTLEIDTCKKPYLAEAERGHAGGG